MRHGKISTWGYCSVCNVPLTSEQQAVEHVNGKQHCDNEKSQRIGASSNSSARHGDTFSSRSNAGGSDLGDFGKYRGSTFKRLHSDDMMDRKRHRSSDSDFDRKDVKRRSINDDLDQELSDYEGADYPGPELYNDVETDFKSEWHDDDVGQTARSQGIFNFCVCFLKSKIHVSLYNA